MAAEHSASFDARLYRAALQLCPGEFRREHGDEMACDFDEARGEVASAGARAVWTLRLLMGVDLARTIVVQWLRTGLPAIGCVALVCPLVAGRRARLGGATPDLPHPGRRRSMRKASAWRCSAWSR